jgi:hypothetical protein
MDPGGDGRERSGWGFWSCMAVVLCIRAVVFAAGVYSNWTAQDWQFTEHAPRHPWVAWDTYGYRHITLHGYEPGKVPQTVAYFPLYPMLCLPLVGVFGPDQAMLGVANVCSILAIAALYMWGRAVAGAREAWWGAVLAASYPASAFFCAAYTEGLFLLCAAVALWMMARGRVWAAAVASGVACAVRPTGIAVAAALVVWEVLRVMPRPSLKGAARIAVVGFVSVSGMLAYEGFLWHRYGRWDAYFVAQTQYGPRRNEARTGELNLVSVDPGKDSVWPIRPRARPVPRPWPVIVAPATTVSEPAPAPAAVKQTYMQPTPPLAERVKVWLRDGLPVWNWLGIAAMLGISVGGLARPRGVPRGVFVIAPVMFLMSVTRVPFDAIARYFTGALPCMVLLALWLRDRWLWLAAAGMLVGQLLLAYGFSRGFWCG